MGKREDERQEKLRKKKEHDDVFKVQDSLQLFHDTFDSEKKALENELLESVNIDKIHLIEHFDHLSHCVIKLQRYVSESAMFLPPYELKTAQNLLVSLQNKIQEKRDEMLPKKKFAFRSNKKKGNPGVPKKCEEALLKDSKSDDDL